MQVANGQDPIVVKLPVYATANLEAGALLMPGVTAATDLGALIKASGAAADAIGVLTGAYTYAATATGRWLADGTAFIEREVALYDRYHLMEVQYDIADTMAVASTSTTTVTVTSLEDNIDASWLYSPTQNDLYYVATSAAGSCVTKAASGWDSADTLIKILRPFHPLGKLNTAATMLGTDAAVGSWPICVLWNEYEDLGVPRTRLDPTKHNALTLTSPKFYATLLVRNTGGHTID